MACTQPIFAEVSGSRMVRSRRASSMAVSMSPAICAEVTMKWTLCG
jgi:hypothetical protein